MTKEQLMSVDSWRGQCLNYFARAERAAGITMETARKADVSISLRHLAGARLSDLIDFAGSIEATDKQKKAFVHALDLWKAVEVQRQFLAHGVATISLDKNGKWVGLFDIVVYRGNIPKADRWAVKQDEAVQFLNDLGVAFKKLSQQLGQLRKRIT